MSSIGAATPFEISEISRSCIHLEVHRSRVAFANRHDGGLRSNRVQKIRIALLSRLDAADTLLIAGEAGSHCVRATVEHLLTHLPRVRAGQPGRLVLLTDCISAVAGFEAEQADFLARMAASGVRLARSDTVFPA